MPVIKEENYDARDLPEASKRWFHRYGHVVRENLPDFSSCVHLYHFEDFRTVYGRDGSYPARKSHRVMRRYRERRADLYDNVGLGAGEGEEWWELRSIMAEGLTDGLIQPFRSSLEDVADDLVKMLHIKACEGEIDMLPWLFRWAFESIGVVTLNRRLNALSESGTEEADKMVKAAGVTNEVIALSDVDWANYEVYYQHLEPAQDYMYSVIQKYVEEQALEQDSKSVINTLLKNSSVSKKNVLTLTMDMFQGALQTVPLTVLMALCHLARSMDVQEAAREELIQLLPLEESKYFATVKKVVDDIPPYLNGVVWETLRMNPPIIGNGRVLQEDLVLGGYLVPERTNTILHHQVACLLEENFPEPHKFKPERHPTPHMQYLDYVFGGAKRNCLGKTFSLGQMALVIAKIVRDFEIFHDGEEIKMINRLHNEPEKPLYFRLNPLV